MGDIGFTNLQAILPQLFLAAMAVWLLMTAAFSCKRVCNAMLAGTLITLAGTAFYLAPHLRAEPVIAFNGMFVVTGFTVFAQLLILAAAALVVLISADYLKENPGYSSSFALSEGSPAARDPSVKPKDDGGKGQPSEYLVLLLLAVLGSMLMVAANDLLSLYMALEMSSLALYVLASFNRDNAKSSEAGLKYFMLGALASGMMLFGMSLVYGFTGSTGFEFLSALFAKTGLEVSKGVVVGLVLIIVGFCFKLSAVPFHMWTPDVYEGAPTPVTAFFATVPKVAAFALFTRLLLHPFGHLLPDWQQIIIFVSVITMLVGALAAIAQSSIKRLLAYSSIGHVGFMLMGLAAGNAAGAQAILIYLALYIFMSAGAFGCVLMMRRGGQYVETIKDLAGASRTHPVMAATLSLFMFSMAGIPPMAGFFGKMYVVLAAVSAGLSWLAVIGVATSVIGGYYYIKVVKIMYFDEPAPHFDKAPFMLRFGIAIAALVIFAFCLIPSPLVLQAKAAADTLLP